MRDDCLLAGFVELPQHLSELRYCNILCGVIRGALETVSLKVEADFVSDALQGGDKTQIRIRLIEIIEDAAGEEYRVE